MNNKYAGRTWREVKREMQAERQVEIDERKESARARKLAARSRKEEVMAREDRSLLSYDGCQINHLWGRKERRY